MCIRDRASIPKGPAHFSPLKNPDNNAERRRLVLAEMREDGKITAEEMERALEEEISVYGSLDRLNDEFAPYYQDTIIKELREKGFFEKNKDLKVYTSLNLELNNICLLYTSVKDKEAGTTLSGFIISAIRQSLSSLISTNPTLGLIVAKG